jgi:hypothetical protein
MKKEARRTRNDAFRVGRDALPTRKEARPMGTDALQRRKDAMPTSRDNHPTRKALSPLEKRRDQASEAFRLLDATLCQFEKTRDEERKNAVSSKRHVSDKNRRFH